MKAYHILIVLLLGAHHLLAQVDSTAVTDAFEIKKSDNLIQNQLGDLELDSLSGNVVLLRDSVFFFCDTVILQDKRDAFAYGNVVIYHSDSLQIFCDSLYFYSETEQALLRKNVILKRGDEVLQANEMDYDLNTKMAIFNQGAILRKADTKIKSDLGRYSAASGKATFYKNVQLSGPDFDMRTDSLVYDRASGKSRFYGPSEILQDSSKIYTTLGYYDIDSEDALFENRPQYVKGNDKATADRIFLNGATETIQLEGDAQYQSDDGLATGDQILYSERSKDLRITGDAVFTSPDQRITSEVILYNTQSELFSTLGGGELQQGSSIIDADEMLSDPETQTRRAIGQVSWQDTVENSLLLCEELIMSDTTNQFRAEGTVDRMPLFLRIDDLDTLFLKARFLEFWEEVFQKDSVTIDTLNNFKGTKEVSIFHEDFQAIADSLEYTDRDSIISLYGKCIIWSDSLQLTGDSVQIKVIDNEIQRLWVYKSPFVVMDSDAELKDQMKAKTLEAFFIDGKADSLVMNASAEALYFVRDEEDAYIGMNKVNASLLYMQFDEDELRQINFIKNPENLFTPIKKLTLEATRLSGYTWRPELVPRRSSFYELLYPEPFF